MHGREGEEWKRRQHMWPVPAPGTAAAPPQLPAAASTCPVTIPPPSTTSESPPESDSPPSPCDFLLKDGRKIQVGDCALFQSGNAPPFIGLIRCIASNKEENPKLCVNWLYRPADIKLAKGILIEAAPNEVFYSFHKDDIPAASLLHPCKVAFLRKGIELPVGISSFVCRRVYDVANKCLWWLTDQDFINERQEEVDQLLDKTQQEMHAAVQSGGRSPKPLNGSANAQQLKSGSENTQNTVNSFTSQSKKKRDRTDQGLDPFKRERSAKPEDGEPVNVKLEIMIKAEIAKITEKGGLVSTEGVEKLVNLMQLDRSERKIDVTGRILVAEVIAATDRYDCLGRFVQLRGVAIFDDWLQEAHKGKAGDGSPKECDKVVEDLLLSLLRALDKLPVNLNALQACNIGKSVNHLRSHKNLEIQKKARSLIDTWKKRVDAEMTKINDAKSMGSNQPGAWPAKSGFSDVSLGGNKRPGSAEAAAKSPVHQPATCKSLPGKIGHSDTIAKSAPIVPGPVKAAVSLPTSVSVSSNTKLVANNGGSEMPPSAVKEEKSSGSSQSCSGDHIKAIGSSWKEDSRSSTSGSVTKATGGSSRHRRSSNGLLTMGVSATQKDNNLVKSGSPNRHMSSDKTSQSGLTCEKQVDLSTSADNGNNHQLIVRLTNVGRSPARNATGGTFEDPSAVGSRASSPGVPDKHDHGDHRMKLRSDTCRSHISGDANIESWRNNDDKGTGGAEEGTRSPMANLDEEHSRDEEIVKNTTRTACSTSGHEKGVINTETRNRNAFSTISALIESFAKCSESSAPLAAGDDMGMNLLASVAAGEISKSESPTGSAGTSTPIDDPSTGYNEAKPRFSCDDDVVPGHSTSDEAADADSENLNDAHPMATKEDHKLEVMDISCNARSTNPLQDTKLTGDQIMDCPVSATNPQKTTDSFAKTEVKDVEERPDGCTSPSKTLQVNDERVGDGTSPLEDKRLATAQVLDDYADTKLNERNSSSVGSKSIECAHERLEGNPCTSESGNKDTVIAACKKIEESPEASISKEGSGVSTSTNKLEPLLTEVTERSNVTAMHSGDCGSQHPKDAEASRGLVDGHPEIFNDEKHNVLASSSLYESVRPTVVSTSIAGVVKDLKIKESHESRDTGLADQESSAEDSVRHAKTLASVLSEVVAEEQLAPSAKIPKLQAAIGEADIGTKLDFDLNEGITSDDGTQIEPATLVSTSCTSTTHLAGISFVNTRPNGLSAPITVAPAKGPFLPPENLLKSKGEPGWKGSAATSAFRPAEPRKVLEMPLGTPDIPPDSAGKQARPPLDIDLNIADEGAIDDMATHSSDETRVSESGVIDNQDGPSRPAGGFDLDLNRVDENPENGLFLGSTSHRLEVPLLSVKPASGGTSNGEANVLRDFDLNDGPSIDEIPTEPVQRSQSSKSSSSVPFVPQVADIRMNNANLGSVSPWFPLSNSYPAVAIQSFLPDRAEQQPYPIVAAPGAQRILGPVSGGAFTTDIYRGPVLSSSPAMAFSPATPFPYAGFPFGSSFPLASTSFSGGGNTTYSDSPAASGSGFPSIPPQLVGPAGAVPSHYQRPYVISIPEGSTSVGSDNSRRWSRQGLDLNAGPGSATVEGKDERLPAASRPLSAATSQVFMEEQSRTYGLPGVSFKRKEPEGGWDVDRSVYKQSSWQ